MFRRNPWLKLKEIVFDYGNFKYEELKSNPLYIKGKFYLNFNPNFNDDFDNYFIFYNFDKFDIVLEMIRNNYSFHNKILFLGPFYPKKEYDEFIGQSSEQLYPIYSKMLVKAKSHYIHEKIVEQNTYSYVGKTEILKIFSNFFSSISSQEIQFKNPINFIIPIPQMPCYNENSVLYICKELHNKLNIPIWNDILRRVSNSDDKEYECTEIRNGCDEVNSILVDDIITSGTTTQNVIKELLKSNIKVDYIITLGKTDYNWIYSN